MSGSLRRRHQEEAPQLVRPCDYCGHSTAVLYCRADSAKLCFSCDREVHSTNQLFSKHTRSLICDACDDSPATILCSTESSVFCQNCDWEKHNLSLSSVHERRPLEGFTGCPSVTELLSIVGLQDIGKKSLLSGQEKNVAGDGFLGNEIEGFSDLFVWDTPSFVSIDDLISSSASSHNYRAMEVPPLPKNRKAACGKHKEEILSQLRELTKSEPFDPPERNPQLGNLSTGLERDLNAAIVPSNEVNLLFNYVYAVPAEIYIRNLTTIKSTVLDRDSNTAIVPSNEWIRESSEPMYQVVPPDTSFRAYTEEIPVKHSASAVGEIHTHGNNLGTPLNSLKSETLPTTPKAVPAPYELASQERDSALLRYKQKKKTRRYDKHIRYESRKARAESRIRVKGRFAKMEH